MERDLAPNVEHEHKTTLGELQRLLHVSPEIFGKQLQEIQRAVADAEA